MSLIITRKKSESVRIGDAVVTVHLIGRGRVALRVDAPMEVKILRTELEAKNSPLAVQSNAFEPMNGSSKSPAKSRPPVEDSLEYKREYLHGRLEVAPGIDVS